jgi:hypothetical protein
MLPKNAPKGERPGNTLRSTLPKPSLSERDSGAGSRAGGAPPQPWCQPPGGVPRYLAVELDLILCKRNTKNNYQFVLESV